MTSSTEESFCFNYIISGNKRNRHDYSVSHITHFETASNLALEKGVNEQVFKG